MRNSAQSLTPQRDWGKAFFMLLEPESRRFSFWALF